jgi:ATP-binding cassette subfamily B protein
MEAGRIIERGTHAELLARQGRYASMWALQQSAD